MKHNLLNFFLKKLDRDSIVFNLLQALCLLHGVRILWGNRTFEFESGPILPEVEWTESL